MIFVCCIIMTSPLVLCLLKGDYSQLFDVYPFDNTTFVVNGKVGIQ